MDHTRGLPVNAHLHVDEEELEQAVGVHHRPNFQVGLNQQVADQRLFLHLAQLVVQRFDRLLPGFLVEAGTHGHADVGGNLLAEPELGPWHRPVEQAVDVDPDLVRHGDGFLHRD